MISQGDTFWAADFEEGVDSHLIIVVSDPQKNNEQLVLVTLTTWETGKDDSCFLEPGEHSFIKHPSCVQYDGILETPSVNKLMTLLEGNRLKKREPVTKEVLDKILEGAKYTKFLSNRQQRILDEQELVD